MISTELACTQVYKGRLRGSGRAVAVKVQRPDVRESIALDVHILRFAAGWFAKWRRLNSDLPSLLDEARIKDHLQSVGVSQQSAERGCKSAAVSAQRMIQFAVFDGEAKIQRCLVARH